MITHQTPRCVRCFVFQNLYLTQMDNFSVGYFIHCKLVYLCLLFFEILEGLISDSSNTNVNSMVKNYWEKRFKKELAAEEDKLKQEISQAVRKKLDDLAESESKDES